MHLSTLENLLNNMDIREHIRKTLKEETKLLSALRRVNITEDKVTHFLKLFIFRFLVEIKDIDLLIEKVCNFTSYDLIESGLLHMSDEDADNVINELSKKIKDKYSDFIKNYVDNLLNSDDDETYCFKKHSERNPTLLTNRGFGDCVKGWVNFMSEYGTWFPDLDWNEIREKISSNPNKYLLIKNPLENHSYEYYFSVLKKS